jgi:hypothetical protein
VINIVASAVSRVIAWVEVPGLLTDDGADAGRWRERRRRLPLDVLGEDRSEADRIYMLGLDHR